MVWTGIEDDSSNGVAFVEIASCFQGGEDWKAIKNLIVIVGISHTYNC